MSDSTLHAFESGVNVPKYCRHCGQREGYKTHGAAMTPPREPRTVIGLLRAPLERRLIDNDAMPSLAGYRALAVSGIEALQAIEAEAAGAPLREALEGFVTFHSGHVLPEQLMQTMDVARAALAATPAPAPLDVLDKKAVMDRLWTDPVARYFYELGAGTARAAAAEDTDR